MRKFLSRLLNRNLEGDRKSWPVREGRGRESSFAVIDTPDVPEVEVTTRENPDGSMRIRVRPAIPLLGSTGCPLPPSSDDTL